MEAEHLRGGWRQPVVLPSEVARWGISSVQAKTNLEKAGFNELPQRGARNLAAIAREVVTEPMVSLLLVAGLIYVFLGEPHDAAILIASVLVIILITLYQNGKTERALEALRTLADPWALVVRDGQQRRVPRREVVPEDLMVMVEGDRIPADGVVRASIDLQVDESLLTGESVPVRKRVASTGDQTPRPGGEGTPYVFAGTLVVRGTGYAQVQRTGSSTEFGRIGSSLQAVESRATHLEAESARVVRWMAVVALSVCLGVVLLYGLLHGSWVTGLLAGVTLAMALIPEEIPLILTIFLAVGAAKIVKDGVLTRRFSAIEGLGSTTVLCVDKTGTLTLNQMVVREVATASYTGDPTRSSTSSGLVESRTLLDRALLASDPQPFDPMDRAFSDLAPTLSVPLLKDRPKLSLLRRYPFRSDFLAVCQAWTDPGGDGALLTVKGAPETVLDLCGLVGEPRTHWERGVSRFAEQGLRVLAVAEAHADLPELPEDPRELRFTLLGLAGLEDPLRKEVPEAVRSCQRAGIRVMMITGDFPLTALKIAAQAGLPTEAGAVTGPEIESLPEAELRTRLEHVSVCARVSPEQKLSIVRALQASGEIVAMTGDGVNDAPALKAADIGVAMGKRGTDVAREAASMVLLEDSFPSIVGATRAGRRIVENLRKAFSFLVSIHVPIAGVVLLPVLMGLPLLLFPVHIVFLEFIIDPAVSVGFEGEPADPHSMERPPRDPRAPIFDRRLTVRALSEGVTVLAGSLLLFFLTIHLGYPEDVARSLSFTTLVIAAITLMVVNRDLGSARAGEGRPTNRAMRTMVLLVLVALVASLFVPPVAAIFHFGVPPLPELGLAVLLGVATAGWRGISRALTSQGAGGASSIPSRSRPEDPPPAHQRVATDPP